MDRTSLALFNLADRLASVETKVTNLSRPQLAHSSIVDGAIDQVKLIDTGELDPNGFPVFAEEVVARLGEQEDGGNGVSVFNGPTPPRPVNFSVVGGPGLITVEWFGEFEDRIAPYSDHAYVNVHVSSEPDFTPSADTIKGSILAPQGEQVTISGLTPGPHYVTLVAVSQAGIWGLPAPFDGDDSTPQVDPVWIGEIEAKVDEAVATANSASATAALAKDAADAASALANAADEAAIIAQASAEVALTAANGINTVTYAPARPPHDSADVVDTKTIRLYPTNAQAEGFKDGDIWFVSQQASVSAPNHITEHWVFVDNGAISPRFVWKAQELQDSVLGSLTAGKITTGTLNSATTITVGNEHDTHLRLGQSSLQVFRPDGDGGVAQTISVGGADRDVLLITDPNTGSTIAGVDGDGNAIASTMNVYSDLYVGGVSVGDPNDPEDVLWSYPRGIIAGFLVTQDSPRTSGTVTMGVAEVMATCVAGRRYRAVFEGNIYTSAVGLTRMFQYWTTNGSRPWLNPAPAGQSQLGMGFINGVGDSHQRAHLESHFFVGANQGDIDVRILLAVQKVTGGGHAHLYSDSGSTPGYLYIEDLGPASSEPWGQGALSTGGAATSSGGSYTPPTGGVKTFTKTYNATWSGGWRGSSAYPGSEIRQGYSSGQLQSAIGFPSSILSDVSGGKITKIELYLYANHWYYNSGGTLVIGAHGATSRPASFPSGSATMTRQWKTKSGGLWVTLPAAWYTHWLSGSSRGITIGNAPPAGSSNSYYARVNGYGMSYAPQLRITYTK